MELTWTVFGLVMASMLLLAFLLIYVIPKIGREQISHSQNGFTSCNLNSPLKCHEKIKLGAGCGLPSFDYGPPGRQKLADRRNITWQPTERQARTSSGMKGYML